MIQLFSLDRIRVEERPQAALLRLLLLIFWGLTSLYLLFQLALADRELVFQSITSILLSWLGISGGVVLLLLLLRGGQLQLAIRVSALSILLVILVVCFALPALPFTWLYLILPAIAILAFLEDWRLAPVAAILTFGIGALLHEDGFSVATALPLILLLPAIMYIGNRWQTATANLEKEARTRALSTPWSEQQQAIRFSPYDADQLLRFARLLTTVDVGEIYRRSLRGVMGIIPAAHYHIGRFDEELQQYQDQAELNLNEAHPQTLSRTRSLDDEPHLRQIYTDRRARLDSLLDQATEDLYRAELRDSEYDFRLSVPIMHDEDVLGLLILSRIEAQNPFSAREIDLAQAMCTQIGASLANGQIANDAQARAAQLSTLNRLSRVLSENNQLSEMLVDARREVMPLFEATGFSILLYNDIEKNLTWAYTFEYDDELDLTSRGDLPLNSGNAGYVATTGQPLLISDLATVNFSEMALFSAGSADGSWLGAPLIVANRIIGVLILENADDAAAFGNRDLDLLTTIAGPLAISINNIQQLEKTQTALAAQSEQALLLRTAAEVSATATSVLDVRELAQRVVNLIQHRFELYYTGLFLVDEARQEAVLQAATEAEGTVNTGEQYRLPLDSSSLITQAISVGRVHLEPDVKQNAAWAFGAYLPNTRSMLAIPLRAQRGGTVGALTVHSTEQDAFSDQAITILQTLCDQLAVAIENARLFQQVQESLIRLNNLFLASRKIMAAERSQTVYETLVDYAGASGLVDMAHLLVADPKEPDFLMIPALWSRIDVDYDPAYRYARDPLPYSPRLLQRDIVIIENVQEATDVDGVTRDMFQAQSYACRDSRPHLSRGSMAGHTGPGPLRSERIGSKRVTAFPDPL